MLKRISVLAACFAFLCVATAAKADSWDKKTTVTFTQAVELPGNVVLSAGTYVFKIANVTANRNVVEVYSAEQNTLVATVLTIAEVRIAPADNLYFGFEERGAGLPAALHDWFYPGDNTGIEFVYR